MTKFDRMGQRAAWWNPNRRKFMLAGVSFTAGLAIDQVFERTVVDPMLEPLPRSMAYTTLKPERFTDVASLEMQAALMCWQEKR